ncbi:MAG: hypothetical protein QM504_05685 [Pseudomonadota bacterium]
MNKVLMVVCFNFFLVSSYAASGVDGHTYRLFNKITIKLPNEWGVEDITKLRELPSLVPEFDNKQYEVLSEIFTEDNQIIFTHKVVFLIRIITVM